jgi:hypothetical protein
MQTGRSRLVGIVGSFSPFQLRTQTRMYKQANQLTSSMSCMKIKSPILYILDFL